MKCWPLLMVLFAFIFAGCSDGGDKKKAAGTVRIDDGFYATVEWERTKVIRHAGSRLKLGNRELSFNISDVDLTTNGDLTVNKSYVRYGEKTTAFVEIDLTDLRALQIQGGNLDVREPDYLDVEHYPTAIIELDLDADVSQNDCRIRMKGKTYVYDVTWEGERFEQDWKFVSAKIPVDGMELELSSESVKQDLESDKIVLTLNLNKKDNGKNTL